MRTYDITYTLSLRKGSETGRASISLGHGASNMREMRLSIDPERHQRFRGDGEIREADGYLVWRPPRVGGTLRYNVAMVNRRGESRYDALVTDDWALFRGDDVFPSARTRTLVGARAQARLELELPKGWSSVAPYPGDGDDAYRVDNPTRRFDRPTGWMLAGEIGVRRALIADSRVAIAAPVGENFRRMDVMAFLHWTLPRVRQAFPTLGERLVVVGAGDPMWRGGLSGPDSIFLHADRPLVSENGTSTLLHELVHVAMGVAGNDHDDWVVEGLAEYYTVKILRDSGTLGERRSALTLETMKDWSRDVDDLFVRRARGPVTARAATLFAQLDREIGRRASDGDSLDDVVARMISGNKPYSYEALCESSRAIVGELPAMLAPDKVPGAPDVAACRKTSAKKNAKEKSG